MFESQIHVSVALQCEGFKYIQSISYLVHDEPHAMPHRHAVEGKVTKQITKLFELGI